MPTSNGQVSRYDIRRGAVKEVTLDDDVISTAKLQSLATTIEKTESPMSSAGAYNTVVGSTLDTTYRNPLSVSVDVPTWAGLAICIVTSHLQVSGSGGNALINFVARINTDAEPEGALTQTFPVSETQGLAYTRTEQISFPGSTITAYAWFRVGSGTSPQNSNFVTLGLQVDFLR